MSLILEVVGTKVSVDGHERDVIGDRIHGVDLCRLGIDRFEFNDCVRTGGFVKGITDHSFHSSPSLSPSPSCTRENLPYQHNILGLLASRVRAFVYLSSTPCL